MNTGAPASAVIAPTGNSVGATTVRASVSATHDQNRAADRGRRNQNPVIAAEKHAHQMRHQQSHVADRAAHGNCKAGQHRCGDVHHDLHESDVHSQVTRLLLAGENQIQIGRRPVNRPGRDRKYREQRPKPRQRVSRHRHLKIAHQPESHAAQIARAEHGHQKHNHGRKKRRGDDAAEQQSCAVELAAAPPEKIDRRDRGERPGECGHLNRPAVCGAAIRLMIAPSAAPLETPST